MKASIILLFVFQVACGIQGYEKPELTYNSDEQVNVDQKVEKNEVKDEKPAEASERVLETIAMLEDLDKKSGSGELGNEQSVIMIEDDGDYEIVNAESAPADNELPTEETSSETADPVSAEALTAEVVNPSEESSSSDEAIQGLACQEYTPTDSEFQNELMARGISQNYAAALEASANDLDSKESWDKVGIAMASETHTKLIEEASADAKQRCGLLQEGLGLTALIPELAEGLVNIFAITVSGVAGVATLAVQAAGQAIFITTQSVNLITLEIMDFLIGSPVPAETTSPEACNDCD